MTVIGNILWFLFGGLIGGLAWVLAGCLWCVTIIGDRRKFCVIDDPRQYENLRLSQGGT